LPSRPRPAPGVLRPSAPSPPGSPVPGRPPPCRAGFTSFAASGGRIPRSLRRGGGLEGSASGSPPGARISY